MNKLFQMTGSLNPRRSMFDLSYRKTFTCDMGQLIPIVCDEVVPGDLFEMGNEIIIRYQPLVAPILHEVNVFTHYFFVPYRILWDDWEEFITGGANGQSVAVLPRWEPTDTTEGSLWDFMGLPVGVDPDDAYPVDFIRRAYNRIYNEYYRDENLQAEILETSEVIKNRDWEKDYFTSALPWQQRGIAPALPISGLTSAVFDHNVSLVYPSYQAGNAHVLQSNSVSNFPFDLETEEALSAGVAPKSGGLDDNMVDLSSATTFNVSDLRLAFQIQKWMERNARAGVRYTEFLKAHYGVSPRDDRLQRPEYIGGSKSPVMVSEVLQTSETDGSPQGTIAGHGLSADKSYIAKYHAKEFGVIVGLMSVMPRSAYQQGIDRQWLRRSRYDFYSPEFANLSEQGIEQAEIYATNIDKENRGIFGFQGRYDEMRYKRSMVCSGMRSTFDYWHLGRIFTAAPELNDVFVECNPSKRIFAVQNEPGIIANVGNIIRALRPMPIMSDPGFIDHN